MSSSCKEPGDRTLPSLPAHVSVLLLVSNLLFLTLALTLAWRSRLSGDDFLFLARARQYGVLGSVSYWWHHWTGRWASTLIISGIVSWVTDGDLFVHNLLTIICFILALWGLLHSLFARYLHADLSPFTELNLAVFLSGTLFLVDGHRGQTWYWLSGSVTYLYPLGFLIAAGALVGRPSIPARLACAPLFGLAAGCNESIAFLTLVVLGSAFCVIVWRSRPVFREALKGPASHGVFWPLLFSLISCAALFLAPGNGVRRGFFPHSGITAIMLVAFRSTAHIFWFYLSHGALLLGLAAVVGYLVMQPRRAGTHSVSRPRAVSVCLLSSAATYCAIFLSALPGAFGTLSCPPQRAWEQIAVLLVGGSFITGIYVAQRADVRRPSRLISGAVVSLCLTASAAASAFSFWRQYPIVTRYARNYDARYRRLLDLQRTGERREVRLDPLGSSGWLPSAEVTPDPANWRNQEVREGMSLGFPVRLK